MHVVLRQHFFQNCCFATNNSSLEPHDCMEFVIKILTKELKFGYLFNHTIVSIFHLLYIINKDGFFERLVTIITRNLFTDTNLNIEFTKKYNKTHIKYRNRKKILLQRRSSLGYILK